MKPVTSRSTPPRPAAGSVRRLLAIAVAALAALPGIVLPATVVAAPAAPALTGAATVRDPDVTGQGDTPAPTTSIQYEQSIEHANDAIDFAPGDRVSVPFAPRAGDHWQVDEQAPRALPAGNATGRQMRDAPAGSVWSNGTPSDLAGGTGTGATGTGATTTIEPASFVTNGAGLETTAAPVSASGLRREVFGFLPYWEVSDSTTTLDWRTLSTVAYFSVGCESSGALDKTDADGTLSTGWAGWTSSKMTSIINTAHQNQTRVVLTISCFAWSSGGATRQASLLGSASARSALAKAASAAVRDRGADGINLDFEPIVTGYADEFTALVRSVRSELNKVAPGYQLTFDTMGSIGNQPIVNATAPGGADAVFIMGYDYRTEGSAYAGSISPLTGPKYDLTDTVKAYLAKISPAKVILGVPYYGRAWSTGSDALHAATLSPAKYGSPAAPTYGQSMDFVAQYGRRWDSIEQAPWTAYHKQTCTSTYGCVTSWRELYFDDATSLKLRYDLVNRSSLRGAGIWALGYEGTRTELRTALADKFLADTTPPVVGIATLAPSQRDEGFRVAWSAWDDSTIAAYDVQVSVDAGDWTTWLTGTTLPSSIYPGADGHTYAFRVRSGDIHGNVSAWKALSLADLGAPDDITVGDFATVLVDGLRMRAGPTTGGSVMTTLSAGDALQVIGGPVTGEGYTWWQVNGPVQQWAAVDPMQIGGWVAASGNGALNAGPRRPVYATTVNAGITGLQLGNGGQRVVTPDTPLRLDWTNQVAFDSLALRVFRTDGTLAGTRSLGGIDAGSHAYNWDGMLGGNQVPDGIYVLQLQGLRGSTAYSAPSGSPVSADQIAKFGFIAGPAAPTAILAFDGPASPTRATTLTWKLTFGGAITGIARADFTRAGTATGCLLGNPVGAGPSWSMTVTGCSQGTVTLGFKAKAVVDAVGNWGPTDPVSASTLLIDRSKPTSAAPKVTLRAGLDLASAATNAGLPANLTWSAIDPGGAGVHSYDVQRSVDGGAFGALLTDVPTTSLFVSLTPGHTYRFEVRARDNAGNVGAWVAGPTLRPYLPQQTFSGFSWAGAWSTATDSRFSGGSTRYASVKGDHFTYTFTGRAIAWVATFGPNRGMARVYLDGTLVATIDTYAAAAAFHHVAFAKTWSASGTHTIRIAVLGTVGRPRVDVDALEVVR